MNLVLEDKGQEVGMMDSLEEKHHIPGGFVHGADLPAIHANQMVVQHTEHEFVVTFFEVLPPVLNEIEARQEVDNGQSQPMQARPVARIVMSSLRAREFASALVENLHATSDDTDLVEHRLMLALENKLHPESEPEEEWLVRSGALQELLADASQQQPIKDWERLLDEL